MAPSSDDDDAAPAPACARAEAPRRAAGPRGATRHSTANVLRYLEQAFYVAIAIALCLAGLALFGRVVYRFIAELGTDALEAQILQFLDGLLLVFIIAELVHTVRAVIEENVLRMEPFLIVGIVAAIRRIVVVTAEAEQLKGRPELRDAVLEMAVLAGIVLVLGITIYLVRHTTHSEPRPAHEQQGGD